MTITSPHSRLRSLTLLLAVAAACLLVPPVASAAAKNCGRDVIADWFDNGRVDRLYALHCYEDAIDLIPEDLLIYGTAKEDILRALAFAKRGASDPGNTTGQPTTSTSTTPTGTATNGSTGKTNTGKQPTTPTETDENGETLTEVSPADEGDDPSSVPLPLIILGGLAVLLIAAGTAGYIARRRQGGAGGPPTAV